MSFRVAGARDCAARQKWAKHEGFVAFRKTMAGMGHLKMISKDAFSVAGARQKTCSWSTFPSQNVQNTPRSDHFWKLRCRKSARRWGEKHISKWKCLKHTSSGPLLELKMSKKCMLKTPGVRTTFGGSDVVSRGRRKGLCTLSTVSKKWRFCNIFNYNHHYITLHSNTLQYTTLNYTQLHYTFHYTTLHYTTFHYTTIDYTTLHYTTLHYTTLHYTTLHFLPLHFTTLHYTTLHSTTTTTTQLHSTTLHYAPLHCTTLHYTPLHYITLH